MSVYTVQSSPSKPLVELHLRSSLFGHKTPVTHIAVSKAFSTILTVSQDGVAFLWDLNRLEFVRKLPLARPVECARINDATGDVMLGAGQNILLYTLNGELILDQNVCSTTSHELPPQAASAAAAEDYVHACAFYEGSTGGSEWLENQLVFTGHRRGVVNVWRKTVGERTGRWMLEFVRRLDHVNLKSEVGANVEAPITCVAPLAGLVYTGDDDGRVVSLFLSFVFLCPLVDDVFLSEREVANLTFVVGVEFGSAGEVERQAGEGVRISELGRAKKTSGGCI